MYTVGASGGGSPAPALTDGNDTDSSKDRTTPTVHGTRRPLNARGALKKRPQALPVYRRQPHTTEFHGRVHHDDFHWLSDRRNPKVQRLLHTENELVSQFFNATVPGLKRTLCKEMRARAKLDDASLPTRDRHFWYYTRQLKNEEYPLHCRRPCGDGEDGINSGFVEEVCALWASDPSAPLPFYTDEQIVLDPNLLQRELGLEFIEIGDMDVSPDETQLAVTVDCSGGREVFTVFIMGITDVNYRRWLDSDAGPVYRTWARDMERKHGSVYGSPTSSVGTLSANSTPSPAAAAPTRSRRAKFSSRSHPSPSPRVPSPTSGAGLDTSSPASEAQFPSKPSSPLFTGPLAPPPAHRILHKIDMFDVANEVVWVSDACIVYVALDAKLRPFQLVHHDLRLADTDPAASIIGYEEEDEAFWVGAVGFTADDAYFTFSTASTEASEWYTCPHTPHAQGQQAADGNVASPGRRCLPGAPVVQGVGTEDEIVNTIAGKIWQEAQSTGRPLIPMQCFAARTEPPQSSGIATAEKVLHTAPKVAVPDILPGREYELDHHPSLLVDVALAEEASAAAGPRGGWVIVSNARGFTNFTLFVLPDAHSGTYESTDQLWWQLVELEKSVKLEGVEVYRDFLLLSVRQRGVLTVLYLPVATVREWWHTTATATATAAPAPIPMSQLVDLSVMARTVRQASVLDKTRCVVTQSVHALLAEQREAEACVGTMRRTCTAAQHEPLPFTVESYGASTSFESRRFRLYVSHLLHPTAVFDLLLATGSGGEGSTDTHGTGSSQLRGHTLTLTLLRTEVVNGLFDETAYTGLVVWVPSAYSFSLKSVPDAAPVPTQHPSEATTVPVYLCWKKVTGAWGPGEDNLTGPPTPDNEDQLSDRPLLLNVYGSYGDCADSDFSSERLSLLDRGFIWAYAAVRGGGELGIAWRDAGRKLQRATTVNDVVSVSSYLQDFHYCAGGRLCLTGGSAGGMVVMRAALQAPDLFHTVIAAVPFVDCLNTLLDDALPLTVTEWSECGNPQQDPLAYTLLETLSSVEVLAAWARDGAEEADEPTPLCPSFPPRAVTFPHLLVESALDDSRVGYWEPLKLVAYLRGLFPLHPSLVAPRTAEQDHASSGEAVSADDAFSSPKVPCIVHYCDFQNGHGGANGRFQQWEETAREYAFLLACQCL